MLIVPVTDGRRPLLAPAWHTAVLGAILVGTYFAGAWLQSRAGAGPGIAPDHRGALGVYFAAMALDWALFFFVWRFTSRSGTPLRELIGGRWSSAKDVAVDIAIAVPFWVLWTFTARLVHRLVGPSAAKSIDVLLPRTVLEEAVWILVCLTAGFCEEVIFRGYLQKQLHALTGSAAAAVVLQAVAFGIGHGYQGVKNVAVIAVLGLLYGLLALWRRSTRPGMLAHAWSDAYGGLRMSFLSRLFS
ncbi:MAG TPA: CPBP family intramembrane glutamic endopeptidase [Thermoanaerobaculia bacterium]|nr:CPBP family intramembrane glutamic endopeptidase [Thermoanaerobaculia bacterium]